MAAAIRAFVWRNSGSDVWLSEHHFIEDGYLPSILPTWRRSRPHQTNTHCVRSVADAFSQSGALAEDVAVVDTIAGEQFELEWESARSWRSLESFGIPFKERGRRGQRSSWCCPRLLEGGSVSLKSGFFNLRHVKITPQPTQKPTHQSGWVDSRRPRSDARSAMIASMCRMLTEKFMTTM